MSTTLPIYPNSRPTTSSDSVFTWVPGLSVNKVMPSASKQSSGWAVSEKPPAQWFNGLFGATAEWLTFLDTFTTEFSYGSTDKIGIGYKSLYNALGSMNNVLAIGNEAGEDSNVHNTTLIGHEAGKGATGGDITAVGYAAGKGAAGDSTFVGSRAGNGSTCTNSVAIGDSAANGNDSNYSIYVGFQSGQYGEGVRNVCMGTNAGFSAESSYCVFIGDQTGSNAGDSNPIENTILIGTNHSTSKSVISSRTVSIGRSSLGVNASARATADDTICIGFEAMDAITSGSDSVVIGSAAAKSVTVVTRSVILGYTAYENAEAGNQDIVAIGFAAGRSLKTGSSSSILIGDYAGSNAKGSDLILIGAGSGSTNDTENCIGIGTAVMQGASTSISFSGDTHTIAIGQSAMLNADCIEDTVAIGYFSAQVAASKNSVFIGSLSGQDSGEVTSNELTGVVGIGYSAAKGNNSNYGIFIGNNAGKQDVVTTASNIKSDIIAIGSDALSFTSDADVIVGEGSVFIGKWAGRNWTPPSGISDATWNSDFNNYSILEISGDNGSNFLEGYRYPQVSSMSLLRTMCPVAVGNKTASQRSTFDSQWGGASVAIGAIVYDNDALWVYTASGWKSVALT